MNGEYFFKTIIKSKKKNPEISSSDVRPRPMLLNFNVVIKTSDLQRCVTLVDSQVQYITSKKQKVCKRPRSSVKYTDFFLVLTETPNLP